jgi:carbonic anhydrase
MNGKDVLEKLLEGNKRFISGTTKPRSLVERRKELVNGQQPMATIVTCSDSRVVPEFIFDAGLGELFTIITAGNVVSEIGIGSIEYAVGHLHTPLLVVMSHEKCGAVTAAYDNHQEACITNIVDKIQPAVKEVKKGNDKTKEIEEVVVENCIDVSEEIQKSPIVAKALKEGTLKITCMKYFLEKGNVEILHTH